MKLYTEEQLLDICQSVAEKIAACGIPEETIKDKCDYYGHSKIEVIDPAELKYFMETDKISKILVAVAEIKE